MLKQSISTMKAHPDTARSGTGNPHTSNPVLEVRKP